MINKKSLKFVLTLGLVAVALVLLPGQSWSAPPVDGDGDGFTSNKDCDDTDPAVNPDATEICNSIDDDCDDLIDEDGVCVTCTDADGDGYYVESGCGTAVDCDDSNAAINPGALEICGNGIDDDCVGGDFGTDDDDDGYYVEADCGPDVDCDDSNNSIYPGADEVACNGIDEDCDGVDDLTGTDSDGDGYFAEAGCGTPVDCNDGVATIHPGAVEICDNGTDENCVVEDEVNLPGGDQACCTDSDGDGFSIAYADPCGTEDCNDSDANVYPGAIEICDTVDNQCPGDPGYGLTDEVCSACNDDDSDGYFAEAACGTAVDCDDESDSVYPGATEASNGVDDNCDGQIDEGFITATDSDEDGLKDSIEQSGFYLNTEYELWTDSGWVSSAFIRGSSSCTGKCLNENRRDLFIAWRALDIDSRVDLSTCNIFAFAENPISVGGAEYTVWITRERSVPAPNRQIAESTADSVQLMALLIEDSSTSGTSTGIAQPGTIMVADLGKAWIKSHKIDLNIDTNCGGDECKDADGVAYNPPYIGLKCLHKMKTAIHEVWHVLAALNTSDLHIDDSLYIMYGSILFTQKGPKKTYHIGDQFSPAGQTDPSFQ